MALLAMAQTSKWSNSCRVARHRKKHLIPCQLLQDIGNHLMALLAMAQTSKRSNSCRAAR